MIRKSAKPKAKTIKILALALLLLLSTVLFSACTIDGYPVNVYVKNAPKEEYYLDILTQRQSVDEQYYFSEEYIALDQEMVALLFSLEDEGWYPMFNSSSYYYRRMSLTGEKSGDLMKHSLRVDSENCRIIIVTKSGTVTVSNSFSRHDTSSTDSITFDYKTGKAYVPLPVLAYLAFFLLTLVLMLIIKGIVLFLLCKYSFKKNWWRFLIVTIATQLIFTFTQGLCLINEGALSGFLLLFATIRIMIAVEPVAYIFTLKGKTKARNYGFGAAANGAAWTLGLYPMIKIFLFVLTLV